MKLTSLEMKVLTAMYESSRGNGHNFGFVEDARKAVAQKKQLSGVVSSLIKKELIHGNLEAITNDSETSTQFVFVDVKKVAALLKIVPEWTVNRKKVTKKQKKAAMIANYKAKLEDNGDEFRRTKKVFSTRFLKKAGMGKGLAPQIKIGEMKADPEKMVSLYKDYLLIPYNNKVNIMHNISSKLLGTVSCKDEARYLVNTFLEQQAKRNNQPALSNNKENTMSTSKETQNKAAKIRSNKAAKDAAATKISKDLKAAKAKAEAEKAARSKKNKAEQAAEKPAKKSKTDANHISNRALGIQLFKTKASEKEILKAFTAQYTAAGKTNKAFIAKRAARYMKRAKALCGKSKSNK